SGSRGAVALGGRRSDRGGRRHDTGRQHDDGRYSRSRGAGAGQGCDRDLRWGDARADPRARGDRSRQRVGRRADALGPRGRHQFRDRTAVTATTLLPPDIAAAIDAGRARLGHFATPLVFVSTIGSTNDAAAAIGSEGAVVVAGAQTAGRGRRGRAWFSPEASGLYVSVVLAPARSAVDPLRATTLLTLAAGV